MKSSSMLASWLNAVATPPAVTRYPPMVTMAAGNVTGAVSNTVPTPANVSPKFLNALKNLGVGAFILSNI